MECSGSGLNGTFPGSRERLLSSGGSVAAAVSPSDFEAIRSLCGRP